MAFTDSKWQHVLKSAEQSVLKKTVLMQNAWRHDLFHLQIFLKITFNEQIKLTSGKSYFSTTKITVSFTCSLNVILRKICNWKRSSPQAFSTTEFDLLPTEEDYILKISSDIDTKKAAGIDTLLGRFLKDPADILAKRLQVFVLFQYLWINY